MLQDNRDIFIKRHITNRSCKAATTIAGLVLRINALLLYFTYIAKYKKALQLLLKHGQSVVM